MRDPARIEPLLDLIREKWSASPDLRLGQLLTIAAEKSGSRGELFYLEDDLLLRGLAVVNSSIEQEKAVFSKRLKAIEDAAVRYFKGDGTKAHEWVFDARPQFLQGRSPIEMIGTEEDTAKVLLLLNRLEHSVHS